MKKTRKSVIALAMAIVCCIVSISPIQTKAKTVTETSIDFSTESDAALFSTTYGGWSISDGVYKANTGWANAYLTEVISMTTDKTISFDFCLQNDADTNHQFNVGLVNVSGTTISGGVSAHFYYSSQWSIEMGTLNSEFGSPTRGTWYADTTMNYFDGNTHTMTIRIEDKSASFQIDESEVFTSVELELDSIYLVFQATSTEYFIDNLVISTLEKEEVVKNYNGATVDFEEAQDGNIFGSTYGGWSVADGVYKADSAWANGYLNYLIPFTDDNQISFDFCLQSEEDTSHQFNVGLVNVSGETISGGITAHFYHNTDYGKMVTLNGAFGNTYEDWRADKTTNYFDGLTHTMIITIEAGYASYQIDGEEVFTNVEIGLDSGYLMFQSTSTEYTVDNLAVKDVAAKVAGYSCTLNGNVGLNFHMAMSSIALEDNYDDVTVEFTLDDETQTVAYADAKQDDAGYVVFTCNVPVKEMTEPITAEVYNGDTKLGTSKYTVKEYADAILSDVITYGQEVPLVQAMLNYGSYAQKYFGYRTEDLANGDTHLGDTVLDDVEQSTFEPYKENISRGNDDVKLYGASLVLESVTTLRLYFTGAQVDTATCEAGELIQKGSYYYIDIENILPQKLAEDYTVTLNYGEGESVDITYNCMAYCYQALSSSNENLKNLVRALYLYNQAAMDYDMNRSDAASTYGANDTVFETLSVAYEECEAEYTLYVSPDGNDENDGTTRNEAVATVAQAQTLVQAYLAAGGSGDCLILLDDGEYFVSETLELTASDVGTDSNLYIRAINANQATLTGAKQVAADSIVEVEDEELGRVWKIPCTEAINQLYIDNSYAIRARFPDAGEELRVLNWDKVMLNVIIDSADVAGFELSDFEGSTMVANIMWAESYLRVTGVEDNGDGTGVINILGDDTGVFTRTSPPARARQSYHFENAKAFLSTYGEWYYAEEEGVVYYLPYENETLENTTVRIPYTEELLSIQGTAENPVENVFIEGLNFKWTDNRCIDGKIGNQANKDDGTNKRFAGTVNDGRPVAAVSLEYAKNITFSGNVFACTGGGAVDFVEGVQDSVVEKNVFSAIGGNGVLAGATNYSVDAVSTEEASFIKNVTVENNYFSDICWQEYSGCAVIFTYAVDSTITHNTINNTRYTGISVGWGWKKTEFSFLQNNEISYNKVTNAVNLLSDAAAIYLVGCQPNTVVKNNYIDNIYNSVYKYPEDTYDDTQVKFVTAGIYLDQGVGGTTDDDKVQVVDNVIVEGNVEYQTYQTHNAKTGYYEVTEPEESEEATIIDEAGVTEEGFTLLPKTSVLYGSHTESEKQVSIYGENLGNGSKSVLMVKGADGKFAQLSKDDIVSWNDEKITFTTSNCISGEMYILNNNGVTSNKITVTCNVDEAYCMYDRFTNEWGGLDGLDALLTETQTISSDSDDFACSTYLEGYEASAIADGSKSTGWSCGAEDANPWVSFSLAESSTVEKILIYARAGVDQKECRMNFNIYGYDAEGNEYLIYSADNTAPVFDSNGVLAVDVNATEYKDIEFTSFKIARPENDSTYFFVAEVAIV